MRVTVDLEKRLLELDERDNGGECILFHLDFLSIFAQAPHGTIVRLNKRADGVVMITRMLELEKMTGYMTS